MNPFDKYFGPEDRLHIACCDFLDMQFPKFLYTHPANESKRTRFEQYKAKKLRMKPGVPDLLIFQSFGNFTGLAIEFKIKENKLSPYQQAWRTNLEKQGWYFWVVYDLENFIALIKDCYN